jgi:hypothetical protein
MDSSFLAVPLLGYFDPGSGSLILQVIVGGSAGLLVFAKYVWESVVSKYSRGGSLPGGTEDAESNCSCDLSGAEIKAHV